MPFVANMSLSALAQKTDMNQKAEFTSSKEFTFYIFCFMAKSQVLSPSLPRSGNQRCPLPSPFPLQSGPSYPQLHPPQQERAMQL